MVVPHANEPSNLSKEVLYIGSAVPLETSVGLDAIQQPLATRYPFSDDDIEGIPSLLTIFPSGIELKYVDDPAHVVFFPYSALNLCAAVRCVTTTNPTTNEATNRFVSLTESPNSDRPAIFTTITRRTQGRHVLECSGFLTKNPKDALDLVQWTSAADKKSKMTGGVLTMGEGSTNGQDSSFYSEGNLFPQTPVNIVSGGSVTNRQNSVKPGSYDQLPKDGYFYTTEKANPKKFSLHKFVRVQGPPPQPPQIPLPPTPAPVPVVEPAPSEAGDKRSIYSVPVAPRPAPRLVAVPGPPPAPTQVPIILAPAPAPAPRPIIIAQPPQPPRPRFVQPIMVRPAPMMIRPPPPQPMMIRPPPPQPMMVRPMMVPRPAMIPVRPPGIRPVMIPVTVPRPRRSSSRDSSSSDSEPERLPVARRFDRSFHSTSRPRTPPRDYDISPPRRHSRKEDHQMRVVNGYPAGMVPVMPGRGLPPGYVMMPQYGNGVIYGGVPTMPRSKSVPSHQGSNSKKDKKKKKKSKKNKSGQESPYVSTDFSPDSDANGYQSDLSPGLPNGNTTANIEDPHFVRNDMYGMSRMSKNLGSSQYRHEKGFSRNVAERAFSSSLAAETRKSSANGSVNAYTMNQNGGDGEFPLLF